MTRNWYRRDPAKFRRTIIAKSAIKSFLERERDDFTWIKNVSKPDLQEYVYDRWNAFHTEPWNHQLASFAIGMEQPQFIFNLFMGGGKALKNTEQILTPKGFVRLDSLRVGDLVIGSDGQPTKILGVYPQGIKQLFTVCFSDGTEIQCCDEHLWTVNTPSRRMLGYPYNTLPLKEIRKDLKDRFGNNKHFIPMVQPITFSFRLLPVAPYLLGVLLGDGGLTQMVRFTSADKEIVDRIRLLLPKGITVSPYGPIDFGLVAARGKSNLLLNRLRDLNLMGKGSHTKFIPKQYLLASVKQRIELLQGLMDTDGYATKKGRVQYCSMSKQLLEDVRFLVRSLGGVTRTTGKKHTIDVKLPEVISPFQLTRKAARLRPQKYKPARAIVAVKNSGVAQTRCIAVVAPDGLFVIKDFIVTHNTKLVADLIRFHKLRSGLKKVLVTVPNLINIETWANQLDRHAPDLTYERLEGDKDTRFDLISQRADIYLINYAGLPVYMTEISHEKDSKGKSLGRVVNPQAKKDFAAIFQGGGLIMDELHNMGNSSSLTHRLLKSLSNKIEFRYGLTGTLFGRDPTIMQPQFSLIDSGYSLGETLALFRSAFCTEQAHPFKGVEYIFDESKADLLHGYIQHRSLRYEDYECTDMPKRIPIVEQLGWGDEQLLFYKRVLEDYKGIKLNKNLYINLRQIVSGFVGYEDEEGAKAKIIFDDNPKADRLVQLVDEMPLDAKLVVVNQYIMTGVIIRDALTKAKIKFSQVWGGVKNPIAEFRRFIDDPKIRVLQANYKSIGTGTDGLQDVANYLVFFESPPDLITREQTERRIYRPGQVKRAFIYDLVLKNEIIANRILQYMAQGKDLQKAINEGAVIFDRKVKL